LNLIASAPKHQAEISGRAIMSYIDGFVVPVPEANIEAYKLHAEEFGRIIMELGALHYVEAIADDVPEGKWTDFYRAVDRQAGETVGFSWMIFRSREHRDQVWAAFMADPRKDLMSKMPFDGKRMIWGGFKPIVEFGARP
jgi:uncharacterized protein YbaA (DUF1428 family)